MQLTGKQKNYLRGLAHNINPIITVGANGLSEAVLKELEIALEHHELLKIKLPADDKAAKTSLMATICTDTNSEPVQMIGRVGVIYRQSKKQKIIIPA
ncbi:MAG: ribosome assembly RNA-binding protein YhbY [Arenicella sp.]